MSAELHSVSYITNHLERLPLVDSYTPEKISSLFCYHHLNDPHEKSSKYFTANTINFTRRETNRSFYANRNFLHNSRPRWTDISMHSTENKHVSNKTQTKQEIESIRMRSDSLESCSDGFVSDSNWHAPLTNKRKRSTDSVPALTDTDKSMYDEEIDRICLNHKTCKTDRNTKVHGALSAITSPSLKRKQLHTSPPEQKRPKNRPALNFDTMQRRSSSSTSWLQFKLKSSERKVKIIKVTPLDLDKPLRVGACEGKLRDDVYFRPITFDER